MARRQASDAGTPPGSSYRDYILGSGPDGPVYPGTCRGRTMAGAGPVTALPLILFSSGEFWPPLAIVIAGGSTVCTQIRAKRRISLVTMVRNAVQ